MNDLIAHITEMNDIELNEEELKITNAPERTTEDLLTDRGKTHGAFSDHARITQRLKDVMKIELYRRHDRGQPKLTATQLESLEMIMHKVGRIIAGEAGFQDHWDDIAGYAKIARADV